MCTASRQPGVILPRSLPENPSGIGREPRRLSARLTPFDTRNMGNALAHALVKAREMKTGTILVNLSGRGDKDMDYVIENWGIGTPA